MAIQYEFYRNPNPEGSNKTRYHARVVPCGCVSTGQLAKEIHQECTLTVADIKAVLITLGDKLAKHLSEGHKVHIEGLGYFQVNLHCKEEVRTPHAIRSENVEFKSVSYRADADLKNHLKQQKIYRSRSKPHSIPLTEQEIDQKLTEYFKTHETLTRRTFQILYGQVRATAYRILKKMVESGKLRNIATNHHPVYVPVNGNYGSDKNGTV